MLVFSAGLTCCSCTDSAKNNTASKTKALVKTVGSGNTSFNFSVVKTDGSSMNYEVKTNAKTNAKTVGDALIENGLIESENQTVTAVLGERLVLAENNKYWVFYVGGQMSTTDVFQTPITKDGEYSFAPSK